MAALLPTGHIKVQHLLEQIQAQDVDSATLNRAKPKATPLERSCQNAEFGLFKGKQGGLCVHLTAGSEESETTLTLSTVDWANINLQIEIDGFAYCVAIYRVSKLAGKTEVAGTR